MRRTDSTLSRALELLELRHAYHRAEVRRIVAGARNAREALDDVVGYVDNGLDNHGFSADELELYITDREREDIKRASRARGQLVATEWQVIEGGRP